MRKELKSSDLCLRLKSAAPTSSPLNIPPNDVRPILSTLIPLITDHEWQMGINDSVSTHHKRYLPFLFKKREYTVLPRLYHKISLTLVKSHVLTKI